MLFMVLHDDALKRILPRNVRHTFLVIKQNFQSAVFSLFFFVFVFWLGWGVWKKPVRLVMGHCAALASPSNLTMYALIWWWRCVLDLCVCVYLCQCLFVRVYVCVNFVLFCNISPTDEVNRAGTRIQAAFGSLTGWTRATSNNQTSTINVCEFAHGMVAMQSTGPGGIALAGGWRGPCVYASSPRIFSKCFKVLRDSDCRFQSRSLSST